MKPSAWSVRSRVAANLLMLVIISWDDFATWQTIATGVKADLRNDGRQQRGRG